MRSIRYPLIALFLTAAAISCASQESSAPVDVVRTWTDALKATDFRTMASLTHPDALVEFREILMPVMTGFRETINADTLQQSPIPDSLKEQLANIESLPPEEFYAQSMKVLSSIVPDLGESLRGLTSVVIGGVPEGDTLTHVVTRTRVTYMGQEVTNDMDVVSVKRSDDGWQVLLTGGMRGLAQGIRGAFEGRG